MKNLLLLICLLFFSIATFAQTGSISGKVVGASNEPLPGAHISINQIWGEQVKSGVTDVQGNFEIKNVPSAEEVAYEIISEIIS